MTTLREAAQQALEALDNCTSEHGHRCNRCDSEVDEGGRVITALRAALAQPNEDYERGFVDGMSEQARRSVDRAVDALAQPPLTLDKLSNALVMSRVIDAAAIDDPEGYDGGVMLDRVRGLHRRLAALAQPEQEPVVWTATRLWNRKELWTCPADIERDLLEGYAHPPRRETKQEPAALFTKYGPPTERDRDFWSAGYAAGAARAIEAALKERNT